mmetsp:Transcript_132926/g.315024  ORF Transcript_132926/g.315024 Transcript_132926/m.315024 type:complete len:154 (+) Transcript_132926:304-765(+)
MLDMRCTKEPPELLDRDEPGRVTLVRADVLGVACLLGMRLRSVWDSAAATLLATAAATAACDRGCTGAAAGTQRRTGGDSWTFGEATGYRDVRALADCGYPPVAGRGTLPGEAGWTTRLPDGRVLGVGTVDFDWGGEPHLRTADTEDGLALAL